MRGDAVVQSQLLMAQAIQALAEHIHASTGFQLTPVLFANLPVAEAGMLAAISDSTTATPGAIISGGGSNMVMAWFNGMNWTVIGA